MTIPTILYYSTYVLLEESLLLTKGLFLLNVCFEEQLIYYRCHQFELFLKLSYAFFLKLSFEHLELKRVLELTFCFFPS